MSQNSGRDNIADVIVAAVKQVLKDYEIIPKQKLIAHEDVPTSLSQKTADVREKIQVYAFRCRGLANLADQLRQTEGDKDPVELTKIGTHSGNLGDRLAELGADRYGGAVQDAAGSIAIETGFEKWIAATVLTTRPSCEIDIERLPRAIVVTLPHGVPKRAFDAALQRALRPLHFDCNTKTRRGTAYIIGGPDSKPRFNVSREFYRYAIRRDGDRLLAAAEAALRDVRARLRERRANEARHRVRSSVGRDLTS